MAERAKALGDLEVYPEKTYGGSRFDFYLQSDKTDRKAFLEVKGCTLERKGVVLFPDAPTERGVKHIKSLQSAYQRDLKPIYLSLCR